jgi:hypothetical protein
MIEKAYMRFIPRGAAGKALRAQGKGIERAYFPHGHSDGRTANQ